MNGSRVDWEWQFGGWLHGVHPLAAWSLLVALAAVGMICILFLYRRTLRELTTTRRRVLTGLRVLVLLAVLLCLADPVRLRPDDHKPARPRTLAVLVDRSASMDTADNRAETRLSNALRLWKRRAGEMQQSFEAVEYYRVGLGLTKAPSLEAASKSTGPGDGETHLYDGIRQVLDTSPTEIVSLTDGLDTTGTEAAALVAQAQGRGVPLDFVVGRNRLKPGESLSIREMDTPSRVLRNTVFTATSILEINASKPGEVPVELWSGPTRLADAVLKVRAGANVLPWAVTVKAAEPGAMPLEFRVGVGARQEIAGSTTQVVGKRAVEVLYYQGALQWGYRFLLSALQSDPSFSLTSLLNPALHMQMTSASPGGASALTDLPEDAEPLRRFQIVILAHVFADQLSPRQQQALVQYAKGGGAVFFITPDTASTAAFAGTPVEQMLPVVFATPQAESADESAERIFQEHMREIGGSEASDESQFAHEAIQRMEYPALVSFTLPPGGVVGGKVFQPGKALPEFTEFAQVRGVKPGAEVLAVHPPDPLAPPAAAVASTRPHPPSVLLARQRFGAGSTAVLTTDLLWRWKMSLPSGSRAAETFWQQLMLSLVPTESGQGLRLNRKTTGTAAINHPITVRLEGSADGVPTLASVSPRGEHKLLPLRETATAAGSAWETDFVPDAEGRWELAADDAAQNRARLTIPVAAQVHTVETMNLPPDVDGMRRMAEATGGALLGEDDGSPVRTRVEDASADTAGVTHDHGHTEALWNTRWLIALLLGVYGVELVIRRLFRLL